MELNLKVVTPNALQPKLSSVEQLVTVLKECWVEVKADGEGQLFAYLHGTWTHPRALCDEKGTWWAPSHLQMEVDGIRKYVEPCEEGNKLLEKLCHAVSELVVSMARARDGEDMKAEEVFITLRRTSKPQVRHLAAASLEDPAILPVLRDALRESEEEGTSSTVKVPPLPPWKEDSHEVGEEP